MPTGSCNCGEVSFEIDRDLTDVFVCHCSICRQATGGNGIAVVVVENEHFRWLGGEALINTWRKPGHDWQIWFCGQCGSPVPGVNDEARMFIPAGTLTEGQGELRVAHHIWVDSKADWDVIGDQGKQHPKDFQG